MTSWFLDDRPYGMLARHATHAWAWKPASLNIVGAVVDALDRDHSGRRRRLFETLAGGDRIVVEHRVRGGSDAESMLWGHLRANTTLSSRDLAEDETIALLACEIPDGVFVVLDRKAAMVALAELGRARVASPFDYWDWLRSEGVIDSPTFDALSDMILKEDNGFPGRPLRFR